MAEPLRKDKYIIDEEVYSSEPEVEVIENILSSAPELLSEKLYAVEIRKEFRRIACAEGAKWSWWQVPAGKYYSWLDCLHDEIVHHFKKSKRAKNYKYRWDEQRRSDRKKLAEKFSKQINKLATLVDEMGIDDKYLTVGALSDDAIESEVPVLDLLSILEQRIQASADGPNFIERYIDSELRASRQGGVSLDMRVFVKLVARQLVNSFHLSYTPNKLIANIANLKYMDSGEVVSEKDVADLTRNQDFNAIYPRG